MHQSSPAAPDRTRPEFQLGRNLKQHGDCDEANEGLSMFSPSNEPVHESTSLPATESPSLA